MKFSINTSPLNRVGFFVKTTAVTGKGQAMTTSTTTVTFKINSTFSAPFFNIATNLETGEVGLLYIDHCGLLDEAKVEEAAWVVSCYLPADYNNKSPFGGNFDKQVRVTPHTNGILKAEVLDKFECEWASPPIELLATERYHQFQSSIVQYCEIKKEELTTEEIVQRLANALRSNPNYGDLVSFVDWEVTRWDINREPDPEAVIIAQAEEEAEEIEYWENQRREREERERNRSWRERGRRALGGLLAFLTQPI